jgi:hypothetical protein
VARGALLLAPNGERRGAPQDRIPKWHLDLPAQVLAGLRPGRRAAGSSEEVPEEVTEVASLEMKSLESRPRTPEARPRAPETGPSGRPGRPGVEARSGMAEPVVRPALLGVLEDVVGLLTS